MSGFDQPERSLVTWIPDWPVVAAGVDLTEPAIILHANRVVACSPAARATGVVTGLRRREAQRRSPDAIVLAADPGRDAQAFEPLVAALDDVTHRMEVTVPGAVTLPTRGPARFHGGDGALAARVAEVWAIVLSGSVLGDRVLDGPVPIRVGVADGAFAAACAARHPNPGGPRVVPPGASSGFLTGWPVLVAAEHLGTEAAAAVAGVLSRLGIDTLGALAGLPARDVLARFGTEGTVLHRLARGLDPRPFTARQAAPELSASVELDPPVERVDTLAFAAVALADELHAGLGPRGLACLRVGIEVETEHGESRRRSWRHEGGLGAAAIAERARWQLDGWLSGPVTDRPTAGISRLTLEPEEVVPARGRQLGFWGGETRLDAAATRALARVAALVGTDAVTVPQRRGGRGPGEAIGLVAAPTADLADAGEGRPAGGGTGDLRTDGPWPGRLPAPSPSVVPPDPPEVEVRDGTGCPVLVSGRTVVSAPPAEVVLDAALGGATRAVESWAGPWPVEERWWDPDAARRRARVQVVLDDGSAHLLTLEGGRWWREGTYD